MLKQNLCVLTHMHNPFFWLILLEIYFLVLGKKNMRLLSYGKMHLIHEYRLCLRTKWKMLKLMGNRS